MPSYRRSLCPGEAIRRDIHGSDRLRSAGHWAGRRCEPPTRSTRTRSYRLTAPASRSGQHLRVAHCAYGSGQPRPSKGRQTSENDHQQRRATTKNHQFKRGSVMPSAGQRPTMCPARPCKPSWQASSRRWALKPSELRRRTTRWCVPRWRQPERSLSRWRIASSRPATTTSVGSPATSWCMTAHPAAASSRATARYRTASVLGLSRWKRL